MKVLRCIPALLALLLSVSLPAAAGKKEIPKRVYMPPIIMPKSPDIVSRGDMYAALLGGVIGALAADSGDGKLEDAYAQHLERNHIDVAADLTFELMNQLNARGIEVVASPQQAEATLAVQVHNYGLAPLDSGTIPSITISFALLNPEGKRTAFKYVAWSTVKEIKQTLQPHSVPDYMNDASLLMSQMQKLNTLVVTNGLTKFQ